MSEPTPPPAPPPARRLAHAAGLVSAGTLASRLLGVAREQLFAVLFGASDVADAFVIAFRIPNLLRDLFAEGALSAAFVPTFTERLHNATRREAFALANRLTSTLAVLLAALVLLGYVFSGALVQGLAAGFAATPGKLELAEKLTRIMLPFLPVVSFAAVAMGMLNALDRFFIPALAPAFFNVVSIVVGTGLWLAGADPRTAVVGWAIGTLFGGAAQFLVQAPPLWREGWRFHFQVDLAFRDPGMRRMAILMGPAALGLAATQINIVVNSWFASHVPGGAAWLNYAFRLMQLPLGLFGVAVGTIATAALARRAAARDEAGMRQTLVSSLRLVAFLTIPATFGLAVLARPVIRLLYQHGHFNANDTDATAAALLFYATGLFAYSAVKVVAPAFYAVGRARVPLAASVTAVAGNLALNVALFPTLGYRGLALGTAVAATLNFLVLSVSFHRTYGGLTDGALWRGVTAMTAASLPMAAGAWWCAALIERGLGSAGLGARLVGTLVPVAVGAGLYVAACAALRLPELHNFASMVNRRRS